jgi:hypothetical protein
MKRYRGFRVYRVYRVFRVFRVYRVYRVYRLDRVYRVPHLVILCFLCAQWLIQEAQEPRITPKIQNKKEERDISQAVAEELRSTP